MDTFNCLVHNISSFINLIYIKIKDRRIYTQCKLFININNFSKNSLKLQIYIILYVQFKQLPTTAPETSTAIPLKKHKTMMLIQIPQIFPTATLLQQYYNYYINQFHQHTPYTFQRITLLIIILIQLPLVHIEKVRTVHSHFQYNNIYSPTQMGFYQTHTLQVKIYIALNMTTKATLLFVRFQYACTSSCAKTKQNPTLSVKIFQQYQYSRSQFLKHTQRVNTCNIRYRKKIYAKCV
eukprot:TRINITY_DN2292_c0_g1_i1.p1 TRINITY_DN2292_c0_g1~~TRINITY_DN2292_c0_g1_i1.p1  ORF type:complete len:237 (+),score=-28.09 TRINITY_DN2292_c0_g1_i1:681-1391(+)